MNIAGTDFDLNNKALCIYLSGCDGACKGCHNKELWDFDVGEEFDRKIFNSILDKCDSPIVKRVWVMGGEPLLQDKTSLYILLKNLSYWLQDPQKEIWLWTRFYEIPDNIKQYIDYAKIGEYQCDSESYEESLFGITLASTNQKIIKINH